jgi:multidrug efflux system outer membrane protein
MLKKRPDIISAEDSLESARLNVGVAKTAYFPSILLTADWGVASSKASELFKWKSRIWDLTADLMTPIFTAGKIASEVFAAKARYEQALANYMQQILTAFREVEDALATIRYRERQGYWFKQEEEAAQKVLDMANDRYAMGVIDIFDVVNAEQTLLNAQQGEIQVTSDRLAGIVKLIKSIGGSWDNSWDSTPTPAKNNTDTKY